MPGHVLADEFEAHRVEPMQWPEVPIGVPPGLGDGGKAGNFVRFGGRQAGFG